MTVAILSAAVMAAAVLLGLSSAPKGVSLRVVVAGPPASGKGTLCSALSARLGVAHISTGDILRAEIAAATPLGRAVSAVVAGGGFVNDTLLLPLVLSRLKQLQPLPERGKEENEKAAADGKGWLLDGFPRTVAQARALGVAAEHRPTHVVLLQVPDDVCVARVAGRRVDPLSGAVFHTDTNPPPADDAALLARLVTRPDDTEDRVRVRLAQYHQHTKAWIEALRDAAPAAKVCSVDGTKAKESVVSDALRCVLDMDELPPHSPLRWLDCGSALMKPFC